MTEPIENDVGVLFAEIATALNTLGDTTAQPDPRIAPAVALLGTINGEYLTNPSQAAIDANTLVGLINALRASNPNSTSLADAADCAEQIAGTWSGNDYV